MIDPPAFFIASMAAFVAPLTSMETLRVNFTFSQKTNAIPLPPNNTCGNKSIAIDIFLGQVYPTDGAVKTIYVNFCILICKNVRKASLW